MYKEVIEDSFYHVKKSKLLLSIINRFHCYNYHYSK